MAVSNLALICSASLRLPPDFEIGSYAFHLEAINRFSEYSECFRQWNTRLRGSKLVYMFNWKTSAARIPKSVTTLSISWLNNQLVARSIYRGVLQGSWESALPAEGEPDLAGLIREAMQKTNYSGTTVSLLLAHTRLAQQLVDVPTVSNSGLAKIIQREAQLQKSFAEEAAWTFQKSLTVKGVQRVILYLLPKTMLDLFVQAGRQNGLHLNSVMPVSAVLHQQMALLPLNKGDVAMLAAETGGSTTVVVARADGQLLLVRTLLGTWNDNLDRLALDLKRTLSFITQQYELSINAGVWLFGPGAETQAPHLQRQLEHPVAVSPVAYRPDYWPAEFAKLRPALNPNFIELKMQKAPQRRKIAWVVAVNTAILVVASLAAAMILNLQASQETINSELLRRRVDQLQLQRQDLQKRNTELAGKAQLIQQILEDQRPPVPAWVMGYLCEALPAQLVVTNLQVKWETNEWNLKISGALQAGRTLTPGTTLTNAIGALADRLTNGPFHMLISHRSDRKDPAVKGPAKGAGKAALEKQFSLEGVMR